jgi:hypothetical protein
VLCECKYYEKKKRISKHLPKKVEIFFETENQSLIAAPFGVEFTAPECHATLVAEECRSQLGRFIRQQMLANTPAP